MSRGRELVFGLGLHFIALTLFVRGYWSPKYGYFPLTMANSVVTGIVSNGTGTVKLY